MFIPPTIFVPLSTSVSSKHSTPLRDSGMRFSVLKLSQIALQCAILLPEFGPSNAFQTNLRARTLIGPSRTLDGRGVHAGHSDVISVMDEYDTGYSMLINLGGVDLEVLIDLGR